MKAQADLTQELGPSRRRKLRAKAAALIAGKKAAALAADEDNAGM
nr:hypothetical protein DWUX_12 [Desulfovibrio diazotrophicus]